MIDMEQLLHDMALFIAALMLGGVCGMVGGFFIGRRHGAWYDKVRMAKHNADVKIAAARKELKEQIAQIKSGAAG